MATNCTCLKEGRLTRVGCAASILVDLISEVWGGLRVESLSHFLTRIGRSKLLVPDAEVRRLASGLAPLAAAYPVYSDRDTNGGWSDPGALAPSDLVAIFTVGILHRDPRVEAGATYIELASEQTLRDLR